MKKILAVLALSAVSVALFSGCKPKGGATAENLKKAIIGETTASAKYKALADKAREEKLEAIAKLFDAASKAESYHAIKHRSVLDKMGVKMDEFNPQYEVKSTKENLASAIKGENYEVVTMYPEFIKKATEEKNEDAIQAFTAAMTVEKLHESLYKAATDALEKNDLKGLPETYAVCPTCGNTVSGKAPETCEICGVPGKDFVIIK